MEYKRESDWLCLHRKLGLSELWRSEPFTKGQAWVDILMFAAWKESQAIIKGNLVEVKRGQLCRSMKQLAIRWKWSIGKVRRFLELLSEMEQISFEFCSKNGTVNGTAQNAITTLITITNYDDYQLGGTANGTQTEHKRNGDGTETETNKEVKKGRRKEEKNICIPDDVSEQVWSDFKAHRKAKRAPITQTVIDGFQREADKAGISLQEAIKECCERGWQGFKAEWYVGDKGQKSTTAAHQGETTSQAEVDRIREYRRANGLD